MTFSLREQLLLSESEITSFENIQTKGSIWYT